MSPFPVPRRYPAGAIALGVLALVTAAGCTPAAPVGQADYPAYASSAELIEKADLVVRAVALSSRPGKLLPDPPAGSDPRTNPQAGLPSASASAAASASASAAASAEAEAARDAAAVAVTITTVRIDEVFKGPGAPGDLIEVSQPGSEPDGVRYEGTVMFSPAAKSGYVLFLASFGPGTPHALLNPDAAYTVAAGGALTPIASGSPPLATLDELRSAIPGPP